MEFNLTEKDHNTVIQAKKGDKINILLAWKPSSGFFWQEADTDAGNLEAVEHQGENPVPGGIAHVKFRFRIEKAGSIELSYSRPWSENEPPEKWFIVSVKTS